MSQDTILALITVSGLCQFAGVVLSLLGMRYRYAEKSRWVLRAEWGLVAILLTGAVCTVKQWYNASLSAQVAAQIWMPTVYLRILFLWVPLCYVLAIKEAIRNEKK